VIGESNIVATLTDEELREMAILFLLTYRDDWNVLRSQLEKWGFLDSRGYLVEKYRERQRETP